MKISTKLICFSQWIPYTNYKTYHISST